MADIIRVVIADDTDLAREGMRRILSSETDIAIIGEGESIHETIRIVRDLRPDVLLLDLKWFGDEQAGIGAIKRLRLEAPDTKIIAITVYAHLMEKARNAGAVSAVGKEVPKRQLIDEIRAVHSLPVYAPDSEEQGELAGPAAADEPTEREREVLALMADGRTDKEIAAILTIAESTAKNHVANILAKLDAPNRAGAVALAFQRGLIPVKRPNAP